MHTTVKVKVFPSSKKEKFVDLTNNTFEIYVREPAQKNLANMRVRELIAEYFTVSAERVIIKTGHRSRKKVLEVLAEF